MSNFRSLGPGLVIAGMVALAASWLAEHYATPVMLFALLLGIAVNFLSSDERCKPGIDFASRSIRGGGAHATRSSRSGRGAVLAPAPCCSRSSRHRAARSAGQRAISAC